MSEFSSLNTIFQRGTMISTLEEKKTLKIHLRDKVFLNFAKYVQNSVHNPSKTWN